jgi:hypothetical protein
MKSCKLECPIRTSASRIVPSFRTGHNESATKAALSEMRNSVIVARSWVLNDYGAPDSRPYRKSGSFDQDVRLSDQSVPA